MNTQRGFSGAGWCICSILLVAFLVSTSSVNAAQPVSRKTKLNRLNSTSFWQEVTTGNAPSKRAGHTAVWTGTEMIVWAGALALDTLNDGARYEPNLDKWVALPIDGAPVPRYSHTAVWTGSEMIVWGGSTEGWGLGSLLNDGGRFDPATNSWTPLPIIGAPSARLLRTAIWTGSEMIIWGGRDENTYLNDGASYNPVTNSWTPLPNEDAPSPRVSHSVVWTGTEMIVWGGVSSSEYLNDGARYNPASHTWTPLQSEGAPSNRFAHTAVWTGSEMIIWGGRDGYFIFNDGASYNPATDSWTPISTEGAPCARVDHSAVWTGSEMIVWGGSGVVVGWGSYLNDGGRYDPITDSWSLVPNTGTPTARVNHTALWTGSEMIIWGGWDGINPGDPGALNTGGRLREYSFKVYFPFSSKE